MASRAAVLLLVAATAAGAQGCSQCRDTVSQTNPAVAHSYRVAITLMIGAAGVLSGAMVWVIRRSG